MHTSSSLYRKIIDDLIPKEYRIIVPNILNNQKRREFMLQNNMPK
jgi:hypothetical protein